MQLEHLNYLIALETYGSINKTSQALHTTAQNISRILKNLEDELDTLLFLRTPHGIIFTDSGQEMLAFAKSTTAQLKQIKRSIHLRQTHAQLSGEVLLYSTNAVNEAVLNDILVDFQLAYPGITLNNSIVDWLAGYEIIHQYPLSIGVLPFIADKNTALTLEITPLFQMQSIAIMHKDHHLAKCTSIKVAQLLTEKLLFFTKEDFSKTETAYYLESHDLTHQVPITTTGNLNAYYQLAAMGNYICLATEEAYNKQRIPYREQLVGIPMEGESGKNTCALVTNKQATFTPAQQCFITFVKNYFQPTKKHSAQEQMP